MLRLLFILLVFVVVPYAQTDTTDVVTGYKLGQSKINTPKKEYVIKTATFYFDSSSYKIKKTDIARLKKRAEQFSGKKIEIVGWASPDGNKERNLLLAKKRASVINSYFNCQDIKVNIKSYSKNLKPETYRKVVVRVLE